MILIRILGFSLLFACLLLVLASAAREPLRISSHFRQRHPHLQFQRVPHTNTRQDLIMLIGVILLKFTNLAWVGLGYVLFAVVYFSEVSGYVCVSPNTASR